MESGDILEKLNGTITQLSHVFRLKQQEVFIIRILPSSTSIAVFVRRHSQLSWQKHLKIGSAYMLTRLRKGRLFKNTEYETEVLLTTSKTEIAPCEAIQQAEEPTPSHLLSFSGVVTSADSSLQLFQLNNDVQLLLTAISGVTSCPQLLVGDNVVVFNVHWTSAQRRLTACACTWVEVLNRELTASVSHFDTAVHTFHTFSMPPSAADWYRRTTDLVALAASDTTVPLDGEKSAVFQLLRTTGYRGVERGLVREFACTPHRCVTSVQFEPPFELHRLPDVLSTSEPDLPESVNRWRHGAATTERRLVAVLDRDASGGWRLSAGATSVPLLLLGGPATTEGLEGLVSLLRPTVVWEQLPAAPPLHYLVTHRQAATRLQARPQACEQQQSQQPLPDAPRLLLYQSSAPRASPNGTRRWLHGLLQEAGCSRPVLLLLSGNAVRLAATLQPAGSYVLLSSDRLWTARRQGNCGLPERLVSCFPQCAVLSAPNDLQLVPRVDPSPTSPTFLPHTTEALSVGELTAYRSDNLLLTVRGVILERTHARDRFVRYRGPAPLSLDTHKVVLRLGDPVSGVEVVLYVVEPAEWLSLLGLVPGSHLIASYIRCVTTSGSTHLVTTVLSDLEVTDWQPQTVQNAVKRPRLHLPLQLLCAALPEPTLSRWVTLACVMDLCRASLSAVCPLCQRNVTAGVCTFVGCRGRRQSTVTARARVMLDDGTAVVAAHLVGDSVRQLLDATADQWQMLTAEAGRHGEIYHIQPRQNNKAPPTDLLGSLCQAPSIRRPIVCELKKFDVTASEGAAGGPVKSVFCEAVMSAPPALVEQLFPTQPAPAGR